LKTAQIAASYRTVGCAAPLMQISGKPVASTNGKKLRFLSSIFRRQFERMFVPANAITLA